MLLQIIYSPSSPKAFPGSGNDGMVGGLMATGELIGEGFDCPELSILLLATPIELNGRLLQCLG
jgi:hypothetical protein